MVGAAFATVTSGMSAAPAGALMKLSEVSVTTSLPSDSAGAFHSSGAFFSVFFFCAAPAGGARGNDATAAHIAAKPNRRERLRGMRLAPVFVCTPKGLYSPAQGQPANAGATLGTYAHRVRRSFTQFIQGALEDSRPW